MTPDKYENVIIDVGICTGEQYKIGYKSSIDDGVYVCKEGVVVITDNIFRAVFPCLWDYQGNKIDICNCRSMSQFVEEISEEALRWRQERKQDIIARYQRIVMASKTPIVVHHGDCHIWSLTPFCSCGLLHDLAPLPSDLIEELYPDYGDDCGKQFKAVEDRRDDGTGTPRTHD